MSAKLVNIFDYTPRYRPMPDKPATIIFMPIVTIERCQSTTTAKRKVKLPNQFLELPCDSK